jgi:P-type Cu+ transporter
LKSCTHCGEPCSVPIERGDSSFCCGGCEAVHRFLNQQGLEGYYGLAEGARGLRVQADRPEDQLEVLKGRDFEETFVRYRDVERVQYVFRIPSIHCRACVWLLEKLPNWVEGVSRARVNLEQGLLEIEAKPEPEGFVGLVLSLDRLGYSPDLHASRKGKASSMELRRHWMATGVAGFCFGNVMLFSFPEYLGGGDLGEAFEGVFRWLSLLFTLPSFFYSSMSIFRSAFYSFKEKKASVDIPIALGITVLFIWSCSCVFWAQGTPYFDSLCGLIFFLLIGRAYQRKSFSHLVFERDDHRFFPISLSLLFQGKRKAIALRELTKSDQFFIKSGGLVPVRSRLIKGEGVFDFRMVTGESEPLLKEEGEVVHAGGLQRGGEVLLEALEDLDESELVRMWGGGEERPSRREALLDRISGVFTLAILSFSVFTFFWHGMDGEALHRACAILIVACPCALALSAPLTLGKVIRELAQRGCYVRHGAMVETLADVDHFVFDKTGTLTHIDRMSGKWLAKPNPSHLEYLIALSRQSGHPASQALLLALEKERGKADEIQSDILVNDFLEFPGKGIEAKVDGHDVRIGSASWLSGQSDLGVLLEVDGRLEGRFLPGSLVREGVLESLTNLRGDGIGLSLLSGDQDHDAEKFVNYFGDQDMHFECSPEDKAFKIKEKVDGGATVAMVGDGLNDGMAMKASHLGISVPLEDGNFAPNSDIIIRESEIFQLNSFRKFSKIGVRNIWVCVSISLFYNILGLNLAFFGLISPMVCAILMPISALSVLFYSVGWTAVIAKRFFKLF